MDNRKEEEVLANATIHHYSVADGVVNFSFVPSRSGSRFDCFCQLGGITHRVRSTEAFLDVIKMTKLMLESIAAYEGAEDRGHGPIFITDAK